MHSSRVRLPTLGLLAATLLLAGACRGVEGEREVAATGTRSVTDLSGRRVRLNGPTLRVISLVPSATLILDAIGGRDRLVGRTDFDTMTWASDLPSVGGGLSPSLELIVQLHPDLVIVFAGTQDPRTRSVLDQLGIPSVAVRHDSIDDVLRVITLLGEVIGFQAAAEDLSRRIEQALTSVVQEARLHQPVRVAYVLGGTSPMVAGPGNFIHEILQTAGAINAFGDLKRRYAQVSAEEFLVRRIDVLLARDPSDVPARVARRIPVLSLGDLLETPGPGLGDAARALERILHHGGI